VSKVPLLLASVVCLAAGSVVVSTISGGMICEFFFKKKHGFNRERGAFGWQWVFAALAG
jgi:hypothetical protein